jgi:hypothetical protein
MRKDRGSKDLRSKNKRKKKKDIKIRDHGADLLLVGVPGRITELLGIAVPSILV